jgi:hypothetical protein
VRTNSDAGEGEWGPLLIVSTKPDNPAVPTNIAASSTISNVLVSWDMVDGADAYEIEVDGVVIEIGSVTNYLHSAILPNTLHNYRIRSKNVAGCSLWSELISISTKNSEMTYSVYCEIDEELELLFSANDIQDLRDYTFTVSYNSDELEAIDLCGITPKIDDVASNITGTDIQVIQFEPGTIVFRKSGTAQSYQAWSGIVNSIRFKSRVNGKKEVTYNFQ